ncbi:MAG: hypothetical protein OHK0057_26500 [Thermoflexibacter sp.]
MQSFFTHLTKVILLLLIAFNTYAQGEFVQVPTTYEVYENGEKVKYDISKKHIFVQFSSLASDSDKNLIINSISKLLDPQKTIQEEDKNKNFVILNLTAQIQTPELQTILRRLNQHPLVQIANPFILRQGLKKQEAALGISHQIYVKLKSGTTLANLQTLAQNKNISIVANYQYDEKIYLLSVSKLSLGNPIQIANELFETGLFEYVSPNFYVKPELAEAKISRLDGKENGFKKEYGFKKFDKEETTVNDPLFSFQWALKNTGAFATPPAAPYYDFFRTPYNNFTAGADIKATFAWDISTGAGIKVGLFDDGTQRSHPDLAANISPLGFDPANAMNLGDLDIGKSTGHGTATAGVIAAVANNSTGIAGLAYNSQLIPVQIATATLVSDYALAYDWGWQTAQMDVICSAWNWTDPLFNAPILNDAIQRAFTQGRGGKGCILLFPSGNNGLNFAEAPANLSQVISVSATTSDDLKASFSSFGKSADLAAPGSNIITTDVSGEPFVGFRGYTNVDYVSIDGSSVAVAQAAGIAALILAVNPNLTATQVREILQGSAEKVGGYSYSISNPDAKSPQTNTWSAELGYGRINAFNAVKIANKQNTCSGTSLLSSASGYFDDGNLLQGYANNADCRWLIQPTGASTITLNFLDFFLAEGNDRIIVYNGSDTNSPIIGTFTKHSPPPANVVSNTGTMLVRFLSDDDVTNKGWRAFYTSNTPSADIIANTTTPCLNSPVNFSIINQSGNITGYLWNFGAGAVPATANTAVPPAVTYQSAGLKTISLTLIGSSGNVVIQKPNFIFVASTPISSIDEGFEVQLPANWQITNKNNQGRTWERLHAMTLAGGFAESQSAVFFNNFEESQIGAEDYLQLPSLNFTGVTNPALTFDVAYAPFVSVTNLRGNDKLRIEYSTDCGASWTVIYDKSAMGTGTALIGGNLATTASQGNAFVPSLCTQWRRENIALSMLANVNNVLIRFVNVNSFGNNLYLDNIKIANGVNSPTNLLANPVSSSQINLSWTDNSSNELGYLIERSAVAPIFPNPTTFVQVGQVGANITTFNDFGLAANTTYWYRISAIQQNGIATHYNGQCIVSATTSVGTTTNLLFEDFNASCGTLPAGWTSDLIAGNIAFDFWRVDDNPITSLSYGKLGSPASGCFAIFDSDKYSAAGGVENVALVSPTVDATGISTVILQFKHLFISDFFAQGLVEAFDGTSWNTVLTYQFGTQGSIGLSGNNSTPLAVSVDISAFIANKNTGRVRFRWLGNYGFAWAIDDIAVVGTLGAPINLTATLGTENQVNLAWTDTTEGEDGFNIERSETSATSGFTLINTAPLATGAGSTVTYADNTAVAGTRYWYRVQAYKGMSVSSFSNVAQITTLLNPTALTATALSTSSIRLDWTENSTNESSVIVERSLNPNSGFVTIATLPANANTLIDNNLLENTTYFYRVRVVKNTFSSANSNVANATTLLNAVSNLVANAIGQGEISLQWNDNANNELGYIIERSLLAMSGFSILVSLSPNSVGYTDIGLNPDTQYFYRVYAVSSTASPAVYSNVANALTFPATPTNLIANALSFSSIQLTWQDNATTETEYKVERANVLDGNFREIATLGANQNIYTDANLASKTRYFYRVIATRGQASSAYSNVTNAVTLDDPAPLAPVLRGQAGSQSVLLTWEAVGNEANIAYYEIYMLGANSPQRLVGTTGEKRFLVTGLTNAVTYIFRVVAVSRSGASSPFSNSVTLRPSIILGTENLEQEMVFNIYPNPNSGEFKVQFQGNSQSRVLSIQMINVAGQVIYQKHINALGTYEESINLPNLASGLYLIHIQTNQGEWRKQVSVVR